MKTIQFQILTIFIAFLFGCSTNPAIKTIQVTGVNNPVISLNGTWKFSMTPPEKFWENSIDTKNWADIQVPGECQMQGFAIKHDIPYAYKYQFKIPEDYDGKQIQLDFYGVYSYARVWVNGQFVRDHSGGFTKWSCNITDLVKAGETANLTLEFTDRTDDISYASGYAKHQIGGILRDVKLVALPKQNFKKFYFETDLDNNFKNAELQVFYELSKNSPTKIKIELFDAENNLVTSFEKEANLPVGKLTVPVENPKKWDAEHPNLYRIVTTLFENGKQIMSVPQNIGFREVVVNGNKLLVNGKQVKLRGACRHDIHPTLGRTTTPEYDKRDVELAKECNMNFIRTSHYPPSETFLNYCDKYGIYVEDETAVCFVGSHRTEAYRESGATQNDPAFTGKYLSQLKEMVDNHRNHPCVTIWSIGNENHFGNNFVEEFKWIKKNDTTRPVIYSYPGLVTDSTKIYDIISMHYPSWQGNLNQYGIETKHFESKKMPMLFDEWAHVPCYNNFELKTDPNVRNFWGQSLDSMWTYVFEADGGLGGAIWCMIDETFMLPENLEGYNKWWGILDKNIIPATYMGPTVGYGEWGIIDTWRRKKPEFWGTKKAYSPTKIYTKQIDDFEPGKELVIPVHNRFDHTDFSELKVKWKYGSKSGELKNVALAPHKKGELIFPANDWNPQEKLNIRFFQNDTFLVDEYNIQLGKKTVELPICKNGKLNIDDTKNLITISGKSFNLIVNKKTGLLENVKVNNEVVIKSGPYLNLKFPGERVQYSTIKMDDYAKNRECTGFEFAENNGIATISTKVTYNNMKASFKINIDENGVIAIDYDVTNIPNKEFVQEAGIKFLTGNFNELDWERNAYFTASPKNGLGSSVGKINLNDKPEMIYRKKPQHPWSMDSQGFFYFGLKKELPYTNVVRALKENIYSYSLKTVGNASIKVLSDGKQACRFDKINSTNTLIVNKFWDYNSLLWGNYAKQIKLGGKFNGDVLIVLQ